MCKSVRGSVQDQWWIPIRIMDPYNDPTWIPCGGAAGRPWIPIKKIHGSYVGAQRAGSGGGHGAVETENGAIAWGANVFYIKP